LIASLSGVVKVSRHQSLVIDVGGVGILVFVSPNVSAAQLVGTSVSLHTSLIVREDALTLYGFESSEARDLFELLQTVTGIGPKVAQSALGIFSVQDLVSAIISESGATLERIPGLGKKGSQRLVLELKEKVTQFGYLASERSNAPSSILWRDQVTSALLGLGFSSRETQERIEAISTQIDSEYGENSSVNIADVIKIALSSGSVR
jgi:holliday junction DNA helicase RuvA